MGKWGMARLDVIGHGNTFMIDHDPDLLAAKNELCRSFLDDHQAERDFFGCYSTSGSKAVLRKLLASNVHGVGIGRKFVEGKRTSDKVVQVFVTRKLPCSLLPKQFRIPNSIDGISTDVIEDDVAWLLSSSRNSTPPSSLPLVVVRPGLNAAHYQVMGGTLGALCRSLDPSDDPTAVFALGNNHVFAHCNNASKGARIVHRESVSGANRPTQIGTLERYVHLMKEADGTNRMDAALIRLDPAVPYDPCFENGVRISGTTGVKEDAPVSVFGATSVVSTGKIWTTSYDHLLQYPLTNGSFVARFSNQIRLKVSRGKKPIAQAGDSGAMVINRDSSKALGLIYAASSHGVYAFASPIDDVCSALTVEII